MRTIRHSLLVFLLACSYASAQTGTSTDQIKSRSPSVPDNRILMFVGPGLRIVEVSVDPATLSLTGTFPNLVLKAIVPTPAVPQFKSTAFKGMAVGTLVFTVPETSTASMQALQVYRNGSLLLVGDDYSVAVTPGTSIAVTLVAAHASTATDTVQLTYLR